MVMSSGGPYRDEFDDAASVTDPIESASGIETPTGSPPPPPVLPHAPDAEVAPRSHRLRHVRARPLFPDNIPRPQPHVPRQQQAVVEVPEGEPREHNKMRTGGTHNVGITASAC